MVHPEVVEVTSLAVIEAGVIEEEVRTTEAGTEADTEVAIEVHPTEAVIAGLQTEEVTVIVAVAVTVAEVAVIAVLEVIRYLTTEYTFGK